MDDEDARAIVERHLPGFAEIAHFAITMGLSLSQVAGFVPDRVPEEALQAIAGELETLS